MHTRKRADIGGHEGQLQTMSVGCDKQIIGADGLARRLQCDKKRSIDVIRRCIQGQNTYLTQNLFDLTK